MRFEAALVVFALAPFATVSAQDEGYGYHDRALVEERLEEILAQPEFRSLARVERGESGDPAWLERFLDWLDEWLARDGEPEPRSTVGAAGAYIVYGTALVAVLAVLAFIVKTVLRTAKQSSSDIPRSEPTVTRAGAAPGETPPEAFWTRAQELAAARDYKRAIRELLFGVMSTLERQGRIRHRRGLTNRDYFCAAPSGMRASLGTIIAGFERVYFGRRIATAEGFRECSLAYRDTFASAVTTDASSEPPEALG